MTTCNNAYRALWIGLLSILLMACGMEDETVPQLLISPEISLSQEFDPPEHSVDQSMRHVRINFDALSSDRISISLSESREVIATRKDGDPTDQQNQRWVGEADDYPGSVIAITVHDGTLASSINLGSEIFQIRHAIENEYYIFQLDEESLASSEGDEGSETPGSDSLDPIGLGPIANPIDTDTLPNPSGANTPIDLMVVYTGRSGARHGKKSLEAQIINAVESANRAYKNSSIPITLNLVHMAEVNYQASTLQDALDDLKTDKDGLMDEVHRLRDEHQADLVSLVTEAKGSGLAFRMTIPSVHFAPFAFSVVASDYLSSNILAHELGHNQGSNHETENRSDKKRSISPYAYGYRRCQNDGNGFRTIMAYSCKGAAGIPYFSNPNISYNGFPIGSSGTANNAKSMAETAPIVASFRGPSKLVPLAPSNLLATGLSPSSIELTWQSSNNTGSRTFEIEQRRPKTWSLIATVTIEANATNRFIHKGLGLDTLYRYRVRTVNDNGKSAYSNEASAKTFGKRTGLPPKAPSKLSTKVLSFQSIELMWQDNSNNESSFTLERKYETGAWKQIATSKANTVSYTDQGLLLGSTYSYRVRSKNGDGSSGYSNVASATTKGVVLQTPN